MARLTSEERRRLPSSAFGVPELRKYPIEDKAHARNALARVAHFGSPHEKREVRERVHRRYPSLECTACHTGIGIHTHHM